MISGQPDTLPVVKKEAGVNVRRNQKNISTIKYRQQRKLEFLLDQITKTNFRTLHSETRSDPELVTEPGLAINYTIFLKVANHLLFTRPINEFFRICLKFSIIVTGHVSGAKNILANKV